MNLSHPGKLIAAATLLLLMWGVGLAEDVQGGFMHDGIYRTYILHIPPSYDGEDSVPLVINLHWGGGSPAEQATFSRMNTKADSEGFLVVYPRGTVVPAGWLGWNSSECLETEVDDVGFISALIDTLVVAYNIDTLRIYATGFCNGAMMVHKLACELSGKIAAFAPIAAGLTMDNWDDCQPERLISIMHIHARNDPSVPYYGGWYYDCYWPAVDSFMNYWVGKLGCDIGPDTFYNDSGALRQRWTRSDSSCELILWTTEDGSHYWPGHPPGSNDLIANDEMWEFFCAHPLPVEEPGIEEAISPPYYELDPVTPGIFTQSTVVRFSLDRKQHVTLKLFDILGREIATLVDEVTAAGEHSVLVDVTDLQEGIYFYRFLTPLSSKTGKLTVIK